MNTPDVRRFLDEAAEVLDLTDNEVIQQALERTALRAQIRQASDATQQLETREAAAARELDATFRERAQVVVLVLRNVQQFVQETANATKVRAEEMVAQARATGDRILGDAHESAHALLEQAREQAHETVETAERMAAQRLAEMRMEAERMIEEAYRKVAEIEGAADRHLANLAATLEGSCALKERISQDLAALARDRSVLVETMTDLRGRTREALPVLHHLLQTLRRDGPVDRPAEREECGDAARTASNQTASELLHAQDHPPADRRVEIVLQDVDKKVAEQFAVALGRLDGVTIALLQNYYDTARVATIDLIAAASFDPLSAAGLVGFYGEVISSAKDMVTLRLEEMHSQSVSA